MPSVSPTVSDIARRLGISKSTVAAALRGESRIAERTRLRVAEEAARMGYRRNIAASVLGSRRPGAGAAALSVVQLVHFENRSGGPFAKSLARAFAKAGWIFRTVNLAEVDQVSALARRLIAEGVDAVVWGAARPTDYEPVGFPWSEFATLSLFSHRLAQGFDCVGVNHFSSMVTCLKELGRRGYRRIGVLHREHVPPLEEDDMRLGALRFMQAAGARSGVALDIREHCVPFNSPEETLTAASDVFGRWVRDEGVEVIVGFNAHDRDLIERAKLVVPRDVAFVSMHVHPYEHPAIAGMTAPADLVAEAVARRIEQKMKLGERGLSERPVDIVLRTEFLPGDTLPEAAAALANARRGRSRRR